MNIYKLYTKLKEKETDKETASGVVYSIPCGN